MARMKFLLKWILMAGALVLLVDMLVLEYLFFEVKRFRIGNQKGDTCIKILHLTDLHLSRVVSWKYRKLARRIIKIDPDILFISGDSIDRSGNAAPLEAFLRLLPSHLIKVAILGNHEYLSGTSEKDLREIYAAANGDLLVNASKVYDIKGKPLTVTGLDDLLEGSEDFGHSVEGLGREEHHFVLIHSPKHQEKLLDEIDRINSRRPWDSQLNIYAFFAGHNHGGQIRAGNFVPHLPPASGNYLEGWYNDSKPYLYLSRGFGSAKIPMRLGARSEITVFEYYC